MYVSLHIICLTCRMTLIFFERKDMIINNLSNIFSVVTRRVENFLRAFEKTFSQKPSFLQHMSNRFEEWIFQKSKLLYVSFDIICLTCRMTLILFFERKDMIINNLSNILNITIRYVENFLRTFEKTFWAKKSEE